MGWIILHKVNSVFCWWRKHIFAVQWACGWWVCYLDRSFPSQHVVLRVFLQGVCYLDSPSAGITKWRGCLLSSHVVSLFPRHLIGQYVLLVCYLVSLLACPVRFLKDICTAIWCYLTCLPAWLDCFLKRLSGKFHVWADCLVSWTVLLLTGSDLFAISRACPVSWPSEQPVPGLIYQIPIWAALKIVFLRSLWTSCWSEQRSGLFLYLGCSLYNLPGQWSEQLFCGVPWTAFLAAGLNSLSVSSNSTFTQADLLHNLAVN